MNKLLENLRRLFQQQPDLGENVIGNQANISQPRSDAIMMVDENKVMSLMQLVEHTEENEYSCEETFYLLDEYVDLVVGAQGAEALMPLVKNHLDHCQDCGERYEILLDILQNS